VKLFRGLKQFFVRISKIRGIASLMSGWVSSFFAAY